MTSNRTPQAIEGAVAEVAASHPDVAAAAIFGSHARGTARATSDLDVARSSLSFPDIYTNASELGTNARRPHESLQLREPPAR